MRNNSDQNSSPVLTDYETDLHRQVAQVQQELNDFVYILSHDFKAPMRAIASLAGWLESDYADQLDEDGRELIELLTGRVQRMQAMLDALLEYSRIGRLREAIVEVDLNDSVAEVLEQIDPPNTIAIKITNRLPVVRGEATRLGQLFDYLLRNATERVDQGCGKITMSCVERDEQWHFSLADNGPGLEEKDFDRIFQIFQTLQAPDASLTIGAGLTLAKKIVEMYGGKIWVESQVGVGSTFRFTLAKQGINNAHGK